MSALHSPLMVDGEAVGDLITVGSSVTFFAARIELAPLDGAVFRSAAEVQHVVIAILAGRKASAQPLERNSAESYPVGDAGRANTAYLAFDAPERGRDPWL
jgi:hypothetical protein